LGATQLKGVIVMSKIPQQLRQNIAQSIKQLRIEKFPGRGGGKTCAAAFGVSPQQWSPWERGMRTPDEGRLQQIADFFSTTVEAIRRGPQTQQLIGTPPLKQNTMGLASLALMPPRFIQMVDQLAYEITHGDYTSEQIQAVFLFLNGVKVQCLTQIKSTRPTHAGSSLRKDETLPTAMGWTSDIAAEHAGKSMSGDRQPQTNSTVATEKDPTDDL
jgi:hypothetical protein